MDVAKVVTKLQVILQTMVKQYYSILHAPVTKVGEVNDVVGSSSLRNQAYLNSDMLLVYFGY